MRLDIGMLGAAACRSARTAETGAPPTGVLPPVRGVSTAMIFPSRSQEASPGGASLFQSHLICRTIARNQGQNRRRLPAACAINGTSAGVV
jgi:hypothetical protein